MIKTERLELRKFVYQDRSEVIRLLGNADFMAFSATGAMKHDQADMRFEELVSAFQNKGIGKLCVVERTTGELVGYCGIESFNYKGESVVELGYRLKVSARGKGYAFEASSAVLSFASQVGYTKVLALTEPENMPSQHILLKLGFKPCGEGYYQNMPVQYFEKFI
ncbi:GNAT family N-acetyltransferase [Vibrio coralliirubri]|uniref:GNAT family N-acetyltransferase n=1 Tax=Vibrio coralliirubri TaxID=1516159 RepID=UPI0006305990|nr:GNAT family N-acetyltransferase [Vibrio coralliirubri]CDT76067.1 Acetyltransferase, GNAT family protein [Vibrio coralliirubri]